MAYFYYVGSASDNYKNCSIFYSYLGVWLKKIKNYYRMSVWSPAARGQPNGGHIGCILVIGGHKSPESGLTVARPLVDW